MLSTIPISPCAQKSSYSLSNDKSARTVFASGFRGDRKSFSLRVKTSPHKCRSFTNKIVSGTLDPGSKVLVVGATGGVGQLTTAKLLERGYKVRALCRDQERAKTTLGANKDVEYVVADCRDSSTLTGIADDVDAVVCVTGTTAFPSARWKGENGPKNTDYVGNVNLIDAVKESAPDLERFIFISSIGVDRTDQMPFIILNAFKVLQYKKMSEEYLKESGLPFTILRPGRLTDGPYTSYDLNTLLKATSGTKRDVEIAQGESILPEATSRIVLAEACVQALGLSGTENEAYEIGSTEGPGPESDPEKWEKLFAL